MIFLPKPDFWQENWANYTQVKVLKMVRPQLGNYFTGFFFSCTLYLECWVPGTIFSYVPQHINIKQHKKLRVFNIRSCHLPWDI